MSARDLLALVDKTGLLALGALAVPVVVRDVRSCYGRTDYLVEPLGGSGQQWVDALRVTLGGVK